MKPFLQTALALALMIAASKAAGMASKRIGLPAVFGELLVGLLLGPTLIDMLHWFPAADHIHEVVKVLAELGVIFLMLLAGLETNLAEMRRVGVAATLGATGGVFLPLAAGTGVSLFFGYELFPALFIGTVLTATSVSISAQTLMEMGQLRTRAGTTILGAAVLDDVMGIVVLSVVVAMHGAVGGAAADPVWLILVKMTTFFAGAILLGKYVAVPLLKASRHWGGTEITFAVAIVLTLLFGVAAEVFGKVAAITGAYVLGVVIAQDEDLKHQIESKLKVLAYGFLVPIFFVSIGLEANMADAIGKSGAGYMLLIILVSVVGKILGSGLLVRAARFSWAESLQVGIGMVSRGEVALIIAGIGLTAGVIDAPVYSVMIVMTLVTTVVTPVFLRLAFRRGTARALGEAPDAARAD